MTAVAGRTARAARLFVLVPEAFVFLVALRAAIGPSSEAGAHFFVKAASQTEYEPPFASLWEAFE
jgi:hypothetical protein